jgi:epsin
MTDSRTLKEFVYVDDDGKDVGANVRQKAKDITNLLQDEDRLRAERRARGAMRDRMLGNIADSGLRGEGDHGDGAGGGGGRSSFEAPKSPPPRYAPLSFQERKSRTDIPDGRLVTRTRTMICRKRSRSRGE